MTDATTTPRLFAQAKQADRATVYERHSTDGPVVCFFKFVFGFTLWHWLIECYIRRSVSRRPNADCRMPIADAKVTHNKAVERFWLWSTLFLIVTYALASFAARYGPASAAHSYGGASIAIFLVVFGFIGFYRIVEILAVSFRLHVLEPYKTDIPAHALLLTFFGYFQVMLCFSILFLASAFFTGDPFNRHHAIWSGFLDAAYFSTVTIATLGYGDFAPAHWAGKLIVIAEVFVGLILILVAFQRVLASTADWRGPDEASEKGQNAQLPD